MSTNSRAPLVSLITPTFRRPELLTQALQSARDQDFDDFEILVCDNDPARSGRRVCDELADPRIRYVARTRNIGMLANVVRGFHEARGAYVMELDDDDRLEPGALRALSQALTDNPCAAAAFGRYRVIGEAGEAHPELDLATHNRAGWDRYTPGPQPNMVELVARGGGQMYTAMFRADAYPWSQVPAAVASAYDFHIMITIAASGRPVIYVDQVVTAFRVHPQGETATQPLSQVLGSMEAMRIALQDPKIERAPLERRQRIYHGLLSPAMLADVDSRVSRRVASHLWPPSSSRAALLWTLAWMPSPVRRGAHRVRAAMSRPHDRASTK